MAAMAARAIWKGSISFGLVNIPIQVFSAIQKEEYTSFNQLCDKCHKIRYMKWCPVTSKEEEEKVEEPTDILEALKASLKVKGKSPTSTAVKAKGKIRMAVSK